MIRPANKPMAQPSNIRQFNRQIGYRSKNAGMSLMQIAPASQTPARACLRSMTSAIIMQTIISHKGPTCPRITLRQIEGRQSRTGQKQRIHHRQAHLREVCRAGRLGQSGSNRVGSAHCIHQRHRQPIHPRSEEKHAQDVPDSNRCRVGQQPVSVHGRWRICQR